MKLCKMFWLFTFLAITQQAVCSSGECVCELTTQDHTFPHDRLETVRGRASKCNQDVTLRTSMEVSSLLLGLDRRLPQLEAEVSLLEKEDDEDLYGAVSLLVIENELAEIQLLLNKLNTTTRGHRSLSLVTAQTLQDLREEMQELETFDRMQVVKREQSNQRLRRELDQCRKLPVPPPTPGYGSSHYNGSTCPYGPLRNVTGPKVFTAGEYPGSYKFGAWGRDPKPAPGKEAWHWMVILTSSNVYAHYVRLYSSLSSLIVGVSVPGNMMIHTSNPTTNTIQGPNAVLYGNALYYGCYNRDAVCRFNIDSKVVTSVSLPKGTRFNSKGNFCNIDACYTYTDLDLATDETGVWVIYSSTESFGNLVLTQVLQGEEPTLGRTWNTSLYKQAVTNTFMACGVLYATRYVSKDIEEIFYAFDTITGTQRFDVGVFINKVSANIHSLNYNPMDQLLYVYNDGYMVSYDVVFE